MDHCHRDSMQQKQSAFSLAFMSNFVGFFLMTSKKPVTTQLPEASCAVLATCKAGAFEAFCQHFSKSTRLKQRRERRRQSWWGHLRRHFRLTSREPLQSTCSSDFT